MLNLRRYAAPADHDFGGTVPERQPGSGKNVPGYIYFMMSTSNVVTSDDTEYVAVKMGLSAGGERAAFKMLNGHATSNDGDLFFYEAVRVDRCKDAESFCHQAMRKAGFSTLQDHDANVPDRYRHLYERHEGGTEWFVCPISKVDKMAEMLRLKHEGNCPTDGFIGETDCNDAITFAYDKNGEGQAVMKGRMGRPLQEKALRFAWEFRRMTGNAPDNCCLCED